MNYFSYERPMFCYRPSFITKEGLSADCFLCFPYVQPFDKDTNYLQWWLPSYSKNTDPYTFELKQVAVSKEINFTHLIQEYIEDPELFIYRTVNYIFRGPPQKSLIKGLKRVSLDDLM